MGDIITVARDAYLDATFGEGGYLAARFEGYKPRRGQVALARAVDECISGNEHLLSEGPTGTGKSLAYLVPATYHAATQRKRVVVVTANIALQEQLVEKDLPLLAEILPWAFSFALVKGRNNFLCVDRYYEQLAEDAKRPSFGFGEEDEIERVQLPIVRAWAKRCIEQSDASEEALEGNVSELPFEPDPAVWRRFSTSSDECKRSKCSSYDECFAFAATARAKTADVVVTNYHLFFANLALWRETKKDLLLPPFDVAILDEAHKAADIARDFFGFRITASGARRALRNLKKLDGYRDLVDRTSLTIDSFFGRLASLKRDRDKYHARLRGLHGDDAWAAKRLVEVLTEAHGVLEARHKVTRDMDEQADLENDLERIGKYAGAVDRAIRCEGQNEVIYIDDEGNRPALVSKLVHADEMLAEFLFHKTRNTTRKDPETGVEEVIEGPPVAVLCTSATLTTEEGDFAYAAKELGCASRREIVAESPFTWKDQALFIVPRGICEPNDPGFADMVAEHVQRACDLAEGRALVLFTSRRVREHCRTRLKRHRVLVQGDMPRTKLVEEFKRDVHSVLLGNESFWAGVDVPGEALSLVIIDRLPFPTPDDPVIDVISQTDSKWFFSVSLPRSIIAFKQGFGRLIRTTTDRGVVVCLDNRLISKRYGKQFLRALPDVPKTQDLEEIRSWLAPNKIAPFVPDPPSTDDLYT